MSATFKSLTKDGTLKRADAYKVLYEDIHVEPGFNTRDNDDRLKVHIDDIFTFIMRGGKLPALEVIPLDSGKVKVVDGHCRYAAIGMAIKANGPVFDKDAEAWVEVRQFQGDSAACTARIITSNSGLQLLPMEMARVYKRLRDDEKMGPIAIAELAGKTRQHVDQLLHLADAPEQVQQMVIDGAVSATEAIKVAREHGEKSGEILAGLVEKAKESGKAKVTGQTIKPWIPSPKAVVSAVQSLEYLDKSLTKEARVQLAELESKGALESGTITVNAGAIWELLNQHGGLEQARKEAEERARVKAARAAQNEIPVDDSEGESDE